MIEKNLIKGALYGVGFSVIYLLGLAGLMERDRKNFEKCFDPNFVDTRKVVMQSKDLNGDGKNESILQYNGKNYLMRYNEDTNNVSLVPHRAQIKTGLEGK